MTFKKVQLTGAPGPITLIVEDNDNPDPFIYEGICRWCKGEQVSNDPDVPCLECGDFVEYTERTTPVI